VKIQFENINPYGVLNEARLMQFELDHQIDLPLDYRHYLLEFNGGRPVSPFFWIIPGEDGTGVLNLFGLHDGPERLTLEENNQDFEAITSRYIVIGEDGVGNRIAIGKASTNYGEIFFLDHEEIDPDDLEATAGIIRLAETFTGFLKLLIEEPD